MNNNIVLINPVCSNLELKNLIFQGKIIHFTEKIEVNKFVKYTKQFLKENLREEDLKYFENKINSETFYKIFSNLKPIYSNLQSTKFFVKNILKEIGFDVHTNYFDLVRIRSITSYAHLIKAASPAYAIHRDTWYGNSESQINWWIPIFDVNELDMFAFYPEYFSIPVKNNSSEFDYTKWKENGGFQSVNSSNNQIFPELKESLNFKNELKVSCNSGDLLLFSAAHLHGTRPNKTKETRFSIDFRTIDLCDLNENGAINVDNYSKGSLLSDMLSTETFLKYANP